MANYYTRLLCTKDKMKWTLWFWLIALIVIHTLDMGLTTHYIGNNYNNETFMPMQQCIQICGIHNACWVSRTCIYTFIFVSLTLSHVKWWRSLVITITILYWMAMFPWLFTLGYLKWPV